MVAILGFRSVPELVMFLTSLLVGLSMVMGSNAINAAPNFMLDYFKYVRHDENAVPQNPKFWTNILTFYTVVTLVAQAVHEPTNLTTFMCRFSLLFRLEVAAAGMLLELLVVVLLPRGNVSETGAMAALMLMAYIGGASRAYFENTGYALFSPCPTKMISAMLCGSPLSGALMSVLQLILLGAMPMDFKGTLTQSAIYFGISLGIIFSSAVLLIALLANPYARRFVSEFRSRRSPWRNIYRPVRKDGARDGAEGEEEGANDDDNHDDHNGDHHGGDAYPDLDAAAAGAGGDTKRGAAEEEMRAMEDGDMLFDDRVRVPAARERGDGSSGGSAPSVLVGGEAGEPVAADAEAAVLDEKEADTLGRMEPVSDAESMHGEEYKAIRKGEAADRMTTAELLQEAALWPVIKKIYPMMIACFMSFGVSYLVYPGVLLAVDPSDAWYTTINVAIFNICDLCGRLVCMWKRVWPPRWVVVVGSVSRLLLFPYLFLCAVHIIPTHAAAYVGTAVLAVTTGYFGTLSMVYATDTPSLSGNAERALAGQATGVCLLLGCAVGSLLQLAVVLPLS